ncbi:MAG: response regulator [Janthinobacterium lividum]
MPQSSRNVTYLINSLIILIMALVTAVDYVTPLGYAVWILYLIPCALAMFSSKRYLPVYAATAATVLIIGGLYFSPPGVSVKYTIFNRIVGCFTIWTMAGFGYVYIVARLKLQRLSWLQRGAAQLALVLRGEQTPEDIGASVLRALVPYVEARVAVMYVIDGGSLRRLATWALPSPDAAPTRIGLGEGLPGQAVSEARTLVAHNLPESYLRIGSALGRSAPSHVVAAPFTADGDVVGVLELGFLSNDVALEDELELLQAASEPIGMAVRSAMYRGRLEHLLQETQRQSEELQVQQEELRVSNEELEERGRALMDSQVRLESQQAELEQTNVQLEEHTQRLERQKQDLLEAQANLTSNAQALERANQYKSEFLANMSHELRTPLNSSLILSKLLLDNKNGNLSDEQVRYASTIYSSNTDLLSLINDILDLAKVEAGQMEVSPESFPIDRVLQAMSQTFEPVAAEKKLRFRIEKGDAAPSQLITDIQRLNQILKNLLSNAFKFTPAGEVVLRVLKQPNNEVRFEVQDTGIGIPAPQQAAIFEAFRQADGTTSRKYGGSGLGLSISREFAQLLGGYVGLDSEPGRGSTFALTLPIDGPPAPGGAAVEPLSMRSMSQPSGRAPQAAGDARANGGAPGGVERGTQRTNAAGNRQAPRTAATANGNGLAPPKAAAAASILTRDGAPAPVQQVFMPGIPDDRANRSRERRLILVIEDDEAFAHILYELAHELDFDCVHANNARAGVELAREMQPCGILLDIGLPDDSGLTVLERLKRDPATRHLPVHIISVANHTEAALHLGAVGYTLKPSARDDLAQAIQKLEARMEQQVRRILVVEDDPTLRENIKLLLTSNDVEIDGVGTLADALQRLSAKSFDCIVMDLALPDGSGYDLLKNMTASVREAMPPVIVYTGRSLTAEEERRLRFYSKSIIIKGAKSPERLLDEVTLFLHSVESDLPPDQQRMLKEARQRDATFEGRKILLAEDDVRNIFALSHVLEPLGAQLEIARDGREALQVLATQSDIDLVLMDIMMPEMDGLTAMQEIRKQPHLSRLPIIALTAKAMASDRQKCLDAGANDYISKPIEVEKLLSLCRVWLSH